MTTSAVRARNWLSSYAVPLWLDRGFDKRRGYFHEALNPDLTPVTGPVRTMVQARQIYSFRTALDLDLCPMETAAHAITEGARFIMDQCRNDDGSYALFVTPGLGISTARPELYTQAFVLFGLANAYALSPMPEYRRRALELLRHLVDHRRGPHGGFTELSADDRVIYRSNPLMHLFEAVLYWMEIDANDAEWIRVGEELCALAVNRLIDAETGLMPENFDPAWRPDRENGRFAWEPGHQFEWAWLLGRYERLTGLELGTVRTKLYALATRHGLNHGRAVDQMWSDFTVKAASARFWPQAERIKAAVQMKDAAAAEDALGALTTYLDHPRPGLWCDVMDDQGQRDERPAKASSFYHIIGGLSEYLSSVPVVTSTPQEHAGVREGQRDH